MCVRSCVQSPHVPLFPLCYSSIESNGAISLICQPNRSEGSHQSPSTEDKSNRTRRGKARTRTRSDRGWQSHTKTSVRTQTRKWCQWLVNPHMHRKLWSHTHTHNHLSSPSVMMTEQGERKHLHEQMQKWVLVNSAYDEVTKAFFILSLPLSSYSLLLFSSRHTPTENRIYCRPIIHFSINNIQQVRIQFPYTLCCPPIDHVTEIHYGYTTYQYNIYISAIVRYFHLTVLHQYWLILYKPLQ